jgi:hypothetical protein
MGKEGRKMKSIKTNENVRNSEPRCVTTIYKSQDILQQVPKFN